MYMGIHSNLLISLLRNASLPCCIFRTFLSYSLWKTDISHNVLIFRQFYKINCLVHLWTVINNSQVFQELKDRHFKGCLIDLIHNWPTPGKAWVEYLKSRLVGNPSKENKANYVEMEVNVQIFHHLQSYSWLMIFKSLIL